MSISPLMLGIFILVAVFITLVIVPLFGTTLLWLTSKLWRFGDRTFKSSLKTVLIILGAMLVTVWVTQILFIKDFGQFAQSSPQSFVWFLSACFILSIIVGIVAIKKLFQESLAKSIGAAITFSVFSGILFFVIVTIVTITIVFFRGTTALLGDEQLPQMGTSLQRNGISAQQETASWRTYKNEKYGFEIKYPISNIRILEETKDPSSYFTVSFYPIPQPIEFGPRVKVFVLKTNGETNLRKYIQNEYQNKYNVENYISDELVSINGVSWTKVRTIDDYFGYEISVKLFSARNGLIYELAYTIENHTDGVLEKIASTFQFVE